MGRTPGCEEAAGLVRRQQARLVGDLREMAPRARHCRRCRARGRSPRAVGRRATAPRLALAPKAAHPHETTCGSTPGHQHGRGRGRGRRRGCGRGRGCMRVRAQAPVRARAPVSRVQQQTLPAAPARPIWCRRPAGPSGARRCRARRFQIPGRRPERCPGWASPRCRAACEARRGYAKGTPRAPAGRLITG